MPTENSQIVIREAVSADISRLAELHLTSLARMTENAGAIEHLRSGEFASQEEIEELLIEALSDGESIILVAEVEGKIAGLLHAIVEAYGDELLAAPFITVFHVATDPSFASQGIATKLMQDLEEAAAAREIKTIELLVWSTNTPALRLYEKLGYGTLEHRMAKRLI